MAAEDKKISVLTEWLYGSIADTANIVVAHAGVNYRIAMSAIRQYVLGNREIGGTGSNDIPTNGGTQILANKRLEKPSFNNDVPLDSAVTATQINFLKNLDFNVKAQLDSAGSDIMTIEDRIDNLTLAVNALQADKIYSIGIAAVGTSIIIPASTIAGDKINPYSLSISVYDQTNTSTMKLLNLSNISISIDDISLFQITIGDVEDGKKYQIVIRYRLI